jgi:hypothetical protein
MTIGLAALHCATLGKRIEAKRYLGSAMQRRPDLTVASWRAMFHFPKWQQVVEACEDAVEVLVELGLPRE